MKKEQLKEKLETVKSGLEAQAGGNIYNAEIEAEIQANKTIGLYLQVKVEGGTTSGISCLLRDIYRLEDTEPLFVSSIDPVSKVQENQELKAIIKEEP